LSGFGVKQKNLLASLISALDALENLGRVGFHNLRGKSGVALGAFKSHFLTVYRIEGEVYFSSKEEDGQSL